MYTRTVSKQANITDSKAIQQAIRRATWAGIKQDAQSTIANRNYFKPFAY